MLLFSFLFFPFSILLPHFENFYKLIIIILSIIYNYFYFYFYFTLDMDFGDFHLKVIVSDLKSAKKYLMGN